MKKLIAATLLVFSYICQASAQDFAIREVFKQMPDSLMPYLTKNNRLDFIDFLDSGMRAEVKNSLDGTSEMLSLGSDSLTIRLSQSLKVDILTPDTIIVMIETFMVDSVYGESRVKYFSRDWHPLDRQPELNPAVMQRIRRLELQNIVKRDDDLLNKR